MVLVILLSLKFGSLFIPLIMGPPHPPMFQAPKWFAPDLVAVLSKLGKCPQTSSERWGQMSGPSLHDPNVASPRRIAGGTLAFSLTGGVNTLVTQGTQKLVWNRHIFNHDTSGNYSLEARWCQRAGRCHFLKQFSKRYTLPAEGGNWERNSD